MAKRRRGWGEHSVYKIERETVDADGKRRTIVTWVAAMEAGRENGIRKRIIRKAATKREALAKLEEAKRTLREAGTVPDARTTVEQYLTRWLEKTAPNRVKESTLEGYRSMVNTHLIPHLGSRRLDQLTAGDVEGMLSAMAKGTKDKKPSSAWTRRQARAVLSGALETAKRDGHVTRNVAAQATPPRIERSVDDDTLSREEVAKLLEHLADDRLAVAAELALRLGLRRGEILALRWPDVDLKAGNLRVRGTLKWRSRTEWYVDTPKTKAGDRVVPLTDHLVDRLKAHKRAQAAERLAAGDQWQNLGFVVCEPVGVPLTGRKLLTWWKAALDAAGLADRPFHATRRTAVTLMAEAGVPLQVAANIVGHASIRMTADVYNRVQPRAQKSAVDLLDAYLSG